MQLSANELQIISDYFSGKPVNKAYVFGSYSRNEAEAESDIDILVDLDYNQHIGFGFVKMQLDLQDILMKKIDLVSIESISEILQPFIEKDKVLIYER
jgi:predicted nucleotidyltransferase